MSPQNKNIILAGAALAIFIAILAPFIASTNPDGLEKNIITFVGGGSTEKAREIIGEKNTVVYEPPFPHYGIEGMDKPGKVLAIVIGTVFILVLGLGVSSLLKKKKEARQVTK
jgi:cobalt/nickel transport protein